MWFLLGTTLTASFFDSLNPSAYILPAAVSLAGAVLVWFGLPLR